MPCSPQNSKPYVCSSSGFVLGIACCLEFACYKIFLVAQKENWIGVVPLKLIGYINTGALAPLASVTAVRTLSFSIYQKAKYRYSAAIGRATGSDEPLVVVNRPGSIPTLGTMACFAAAGATAGAFISAIACKEEFRRFAKII